MATKTVRIYETDEQRIRELSTLDPTAPFATHLSHVLHTLHEEPGRLEDALCQAVREELNHLGMHA